MNPVEVTRAVIAIDAVHRAARENTGVRAIRSVRIAGIADDLAITVKDDAVAVVAPDGAAAHRASGIDIDAGPVRSGGAVGYGVPRRSQNAGSGIEIGGAMKHAAVLTGLNAIGDVALRGAASDRGVITQQEPVPTNTAGAIPRCRAVSNGASNAYLDTAADLTGGEAIFYL